MEQPLQQQLEQEQGGGGGGVCCCPGEGNSTASRRQRQWRRLQKHQPALALALLVLALVMGVLAGGAVVVEGAAASGAASGGGGSRGRWALKQQQHGGGGEEGEGRSGPLSGLLVLGRRRRGEAAMVAAGPSSLEELLARRRGGALKAAQAKKGGKGRLSLELEEEEEEEEEEMEMAEEDEEEEEEDVFADMGDEEEEEEEGVTDEDFNDGSFVSKLKKEYRRTPPLTKGYLMASLGVTGACWLLNKNQWPAWLLLDWTKVLTRLQVWRPFTSFLYFGGFGLNYLLSAHFMWTYMAHLEKLKCKNPAEFVTMVAFGASTLLLGSHLMGFQPHYLGHNLSCYLVYIWSRMFEGQDVDVMGLFHLPAHLLPWFFVAQTVVLEQELPLSDLLGIAVGHLYHYAATRKLLRPPGFLKQIFAKEDIRKLYRRFEDELH